MKLKVRPIVVTFLVILFSPLEMTGAETAVYKELVKAAKAEGEVEWWTSFDQEPADEVMKAFSEKFGIKAKARMWRGIHVQQRTLIELQSGQKLSADVITPGREGQQQFLDAGVFQKPPYEYLEVWPAIDKRQYDPSGWALNMSGNSRAVVYNPKLVPPQLVPKTWDDCTRPEFKGRAALDPRHKLYALHWHRREWFLEWVKKMVVNGVKLFREQTETLQFVSAGAHMLFCSAQPYTVQRLIEKGAENLNIAVPGELLVESATAAFIRKGSLHPRAAQLLVGWLVSEEGQRLLDKVDYRGFPWVKGTFNARLAEGKRVLFCGPECAAKAGEMQAEYTKALGLPVTK